MHKKGLAVLAAFLFAGAGVIRAQEIVDTIHLTGGTTAQGEITKETFKEVTFSLGQGVKSGVPREKLDEKATKGGAIEYASKPSRYDEAMTKIKNGDWQGGTDAWEKILKECDSGSARKIFKQHGYFYCAVAAEGLGDMNKALERLNALLTEYPETQYFTKAYNLMAKCYMNAKKFSDATDTAKKGIAQGKNIGAPDEDLVALEIIKGRALEASGKFGDAVNEYKGVVNKAARFPAVANEAKLGLARCLVLDKKLGEAEPIFNDIAEKSDNASVAAGAYNGIGDCLRAKYESDQNPETLRKALMAYMRGVVFYLPGPGDDELEHARALVNAGYCFEKLKDTMPTPEAKDIYRNRARTLYRECIANYQGTREAADAAKRLKNVE